VAQGVGDEDDLGWGHIYAEPLIDLKQGLREPGIGVGVVGLAQLDREPVKGSEQAVWWGAT
jgi:hypothetical protein